MQVDKIISRFKQATKTRTLFELAEKLNVKPSYITDAKRKGLVPEEWFSKIANETGTSVSWLLTGK